MEPDKPRLTPAVKPKASSLDRAYKGGVPMGGDLGTRRSGRSPRFLVMASKDALGANTERFTRHLTQINKYLSLNPKF